jgi:hypothetical protein
MKTDHAALRRALLTVQPTTPEALQAWVGIVLGFRFPRRARVEGHAAPFDYLAHSFFEDTPGPRDCLVWACRGGGKTQLGAIATLLDLIFKPGIQIRILGGSMAQSRRMYLHLRAALERPELAHLVYGRVLQSGVRLTNGSCVEVLSQSERSIRGQRVQKLRCDEVELFKPEVWEAAQLVTRSEQCGDVFVRGAVECLSTMHRSHGLMAELIDTRHDRRGRLRRKLFKWGLVDVLARCHARRACDACALREGCRGRAREGVGHIAIDDALQLRQRVDTTAWDAEMLCERPSLRDRVYPTFSRDTHVMPYSGGARRWIAGMDFGFRRAAIVVGCLVADDVLWIVDELSDRDRDLDHHLGRLESSRWPKPQWIGADPAGHQRSSQTGISEVAALWRAGYSARTRRTRIKPGLSMVRRRLSSADGHVRLRIDPRCVELIRAMEQYHYPPDDPTCEVPVKDGHDHLCDALRYLIVNLDPTSSPVVIRYY